ncbi:MAG: hypothetical protein AAFY28_22900, partial [Actinomycetota bacterium]
MAKLAGSLERPHSKNYQSTHRLEVVFEVGPARPTELIETAKTDWADCPSHTRTTYRLVDVVEHSAEWTASFSRDAETYFR